MSVIARFVYWPLSLRKAASFGCFTLCQQHIFLLSGFAFQHGATGQVSHFSTGFFPHCSAASPFLREHFSSK